MTDCNYEYHTVFTDSLSETCWINNSQSQFTSYLLRNIKDVVEVSIVNCIIPVTGSNVVYLKSDELDTHFNAGGLDPNLVAVPAGKSKTDGSITRINVNPSGRTIFNEMDFDTTVRYINPIRKVDRITTRLYDENGELITLTSNVFVTYRLKSKLENMCI
tara:strand:- start:948 stop:1427 length:480 start_codon:yes stop_codon:yes gene_type:complete